MKVEYSVEEVRAYAEALREALRMYRECRSTIMSLENSVAAAPDMLAAYAERIKADEGVVPALWIEFADDSQSIRLWTRNEQQAAEEIREGRKLLAFYARNPTQHLNEQSGISGQLEFLKGILEGLSMAKSECDNRVFALDGGDNQFGREATASQCAEAIQLVYARMFREMTAMPTAHPPAQAAQADVWQIVCDSIRTHQFSDGHNRGRLTIDVERLLNEINERRKAAEPVAQGEADDRKALRDLYKAYMRLLEAGMDRITSLGGDCDPVDVMEAGDPALIAARRTLAAQPRALPAERVVEGIELIAAERQRQIEVEGWTPAHDVAEYEGGELASAAACYAMPPGYKLRECSPPLAWPWEESWWKPGDRLRELAKAGALIAAEIDRLAAAPSPGESA